jgi:hypothetical protein
MNELVRYDYDDDDGFDNSLRPSDRLLRGTHARWTDAKGWHDRDGLPVPSPLLVVSTTTALQRWLNKVPEVITAKPLPDPTELNAAIPQSEWEIGLDGKPRPPWVIVFVVYMVDPNGGQVFTAVNSTTGWRMAVEALREQVAVKRMLCGSTRMLPIVELQSRPFKTSFGDRKRPHLHVIDWKAGDDRAMTAQPAPQLSGTTTVKQRLEQFGAEDASQHPAAAAANLTDAPKPVSSEEFFNDEIPWK